VNRERDGEFGTLYKELTDDETKFLDISEFLKIVLTYC
jgi:hypothetical protein